MAELNQADWAARAGYFLVGNFPNANVFDMNLFARGMYVGELEGRYKLWTHPGVAKAGAWLHQTNAASFSDSLTVAGTNGVPLDAAVAANRQGRTMVGYYANLQQEIADDLGAFARWSWNDGHSEYSAFTDISSSLSLGVSIKGKRWGRPDDTLGIAGAFNWASNDLVAFLAAGGTGILVGDGALNYQPERVLEAYYALQIVKGIVVTADYQYMVNPAYNADRGPVHLFAGRFHATF
jgi:high affinity Mn2+ porin